MKFAFIAEKAELGIGRLCRVLSPADAKAKLFDYASPAGFERAARTTQAAA